MCVSVLLACLYEHYIPSASEIRIRHLELQRLVIPQCGHWELNLVPLQEQQAF